MRISRVLTAATAVAASVTLAGVALADNASDPELVNVNGDGDQIEGYIGSGDVSDDGNRVLFADEPVGDDEGNTLYLRDRDAGTTEVVHEGQSDSSTVWALSGDGGAAAVAEDTDGGRQLLVIDVDSGDATTVGSFDSLSGVSLSDDGATIAYAAEQDGQESAVYVADVAGGDATRVSGYGGGSPVLSGDGARVAYSLSDHVYAKSLPGGGAERVDVRPDGEFSEGDNPAPVALSDNGGFLLFTMSADDLAPDTEACVDPETGNCAFRRNFAEDKTTTASVLPNGTVSGVHGSPDLSGDGKVVSFSGSESGSAPGIYNRALAAEETEQVDVGADGEPANGDSNSPALTQDGSQTLFANGYPNWDGDQALLNNLWLADS